MKTTHTISVMVSTAVLLAACGGGGSNVASTSTPTKSSFNVTGTVPGTLIEAFCENGSYHSVNSDNNGTTKHPFVLNLPTNLSCRLVMTTNEDDINNKVVTPIKFVNKAGESSIAYSVTGDLDLSHIDLALSRANMSSDANSDGVEDEPTEVEVEDDVDIIDNTDDPMDEDGDDIIDVYEDDDGDGVNNHDDDDDDGDGVLDDDDSDYDDDHDGDGINDDEDEDDDNDGIGDDDDEDHESETESETPTDPLVTTPSAGRLLASQCTQCHGSDGNPDNGFENLVGEEIYGDLIEMKRESKLELMHLQALGYSDEQIRLMDEYFNNLGDK